MLEFLMLSGAIYLIISSIATIATLWLCYKLIKLYEPLMKKFDRELGAE